jgi:hypothetical protein
LCFVDDDQAAVRHKAPQFVDPRVSQKPLRFGQVTGSIGASLLVRFEYNPGQRGLSDLARAKQDDGFALEKGCLNLGLEEARDH